MGVHCNPWQADFLWLIVPGLASNGHYCSHLFAHPRGLETTQIPFTQNHTQFRRYRPHCLCPLDHFLRINQIGKFSFHYPRLPWIRLIFCRCHWAHHSEKTLFTPRYLHGVDCYARHRVDLLFAPRSATSHCRTTQFVLRLGNHNRHTQRCTGSHIHHPQ